MAKADARLVAALRKWARGLAVPVAAVGVLVCVGFLVHSPALARLVEGRFILQLNTGLGFVLAGVGLRLCAADRVRVRWAVAAGVATAALGAFILVEYAADWRPSLFGLGAGQQMEPETALTFVLTGVSLALLALERAWTARAAQALAGAAMMVSLAALFSHVYSVNFVFGIAAYTRMSTSAIGSFLLLGIGILFARPERGWMAEVVSDSVAGFAARRLLPMVIAIPLALGAVGLLGSELQWWNGKFGLTVVALASIAAFVVLITLTNRALDRTDGARMRLAAVLLEEAERRHLARELHDEIGQALTALKIRLELAVRSHPELAETSRLVDELMSRVSNLSLDLRPAMLDDLGLLPALLWLFERYTAQTHVQVDFQHEGLGGRFSPESETAAFRIVQEALTNAARHSGAERVTVRVWAQEGTLAVQVSDRGRGFEPEAAIAAAATAGLVGMRERAAALGGRFTVEAAPGAGARLLAELPLHPAARPVLT